MARRGGRAARTSRLVMMPGPVDQHFWVPRSRDGLYIGSYEGVFRSEGAEDPIFDAVYGMDDACHELERL